jgi:hypothetical protein
MKISIVLFVSVFLFAYAQKDGSSLILYPKNRVHFNQSELITLNHSQSGNYSNLLLKKAWIYVAGTNHVFKLNAYNISDKRADFYKERSFHATIKSTSSNETLQNYIKLLMSRDSAKDLIICGTNLGRPHVYDIKETDLANSVELNGIYMCPGVADLKNLGLISYDGSSLNNPKIKTKGIMYSAVWLTSESFNETNSQYSRYGIFRKEIETKDNFIKTNPNVNWLWEPEFLSVIEDVNFVYFFLTENSIEDFSSKYRENMTYFEQRRDLNQRLNISRVSRVARVCKTDQGMYSQKHPHLNDVWTSFRKVNIDCNCKISTHANSIMELTFKNLKLVKNLNERTLIGVFSEELSLDLFGNHDKSQVYSVFCSFKLEKLREVLSEKRFWLNREKYRLDQVDLDFYDTDFECDNMPSVNSNTNNQDPKLRFYETQKELDNLYKFLSENTLLDTKLDGECSFILPYEIKSVSIESSNEKLVDKQTIVLATKLGKIIKLDRSGDLYDNVTIIEFENNDQINEVLFNNESSSIYLATTKNLVQINLESVGQKICFNKKTCNECKKENRCDWNADLDQKCSLKKGLNNDSKIESCNNILNLRAVENSSMVLICNMEHFDQNYWLSFRNSSVEWLKNGNLLDFEDHRVSINTDLILYNLKPSHSGIYSCIFGDYRREFNLTVLSHDKIDHFNTFNQFSNEWKDRIEKLSSKLNIFEKECL